MATETISPPPAPAQKVSRYRSVRKAQEQQQHHSQPEQPVPAVPPMPPMPAVPEAPSAQKDAPISRSMSRYHRRPTASHATPPALPTARANTLQSHQAPPPPVQPPTSTSRNRAVSSPQHAVHSGSAVAQQRPRTSRQRGEASPPEGSPQHASHSASNSQQQRPRTARQRGEASPQTSSRQQSLQNDDAARQLLLKERERQRLLKEKYEAEARLKREAKQAELDRQERLRKEQEEAALLEAQRAAEEVEALRRQKEEQKAEHERGKRLRKAEAQKMVQQREEEAARARQEEKERKARQEQEQARKAPSSSPPVSPPRQDGNFGMFKRRKDNGLTPDSPEEASRAPRISLSGDRETGAIRPGGGGIVPGIDAPTSAVNAGERRVSVVCGSKRILLPVTPTTTPLDLIKTAATVLTEPIDVRTAVMQEMFIKVSITRPLRNYEYVRDVMNSWDSDNQNDLTIVHADESGIDQDDLLAYKVQPNRPEGMSCFIHYSSRPGKWSKRYITLRPDGQLVMAKNEKAKEKDTESVLTMTDYDIYSVTQTKLAKVKPPKKMCYCVKSLRKSNIFADESQYVHFFSTSDPEIATLFYKALQHWRSWYLKHELGEGMKKKTPAQRLASGGDSAPASASHSRGESVGSHYQLGQFSSLLDMDDFNKQLDKIEVHFPGEFPEDRPLAGLDSRAIHQRNKSLRVKQPPPSSFNRSATALDSNSQTQNSRQNSMRRSVDLSDDTFAPGGLLGRTYTQRQVSAQDREQRHNGPFTEGPSLISGMDSRLAALAANESGLNRRSSVRSNHQRTSSDLKRSASKRAPGMPEPLIDLTPTYKPPPQHANKGKGYNVSSAGGPLVESATSPEEAIRLPPSSDWRARVAATKGHGATASSGPLVESATSLDEAIRLPPSADWRTRVAASKGHGAGGGHERTRSIKHRGEPLAAYTYNNHTCSPDDANEAFTGGGLVSTAGFSQGHAPVGRGVMDGSKARGPMIDLRGEGAFVQGGLLAGVPDGAGPVIDRSGK